MQRFARNRRGAIGLMFALAAMSVMMAVGIGIDLARTYLARQELSAVATLTCQFANRPTIIQLAYGSGGSTSYVSSVNTYYAQAFAGQNANWTQNNSTPFSFTAGGAGTISLSASIPTTMIKMIGFSSLAVGVTQQCFSTMGNVPQPTPDASNTTPITEGFENSANPHMAWYKPNGTELGYETGTAVPVTNTATNTAGYVGTTGVEWIIMGYCLEIDTSGETVNQDAQGTHGAELDCDNGSGTAGNSSISTKVYLQATTYELRWNYTSRSTDTYYDTSYICGSTAAEMTWANDPNYVLPGGKTLGARTNQINVYLDQNSTGLPPTHTTLDGTQTLAGSNLIDECLYSLPPPASATTYPYGWIERSVPITVSTAGNYWLSFAADGASDSYGGQIDNIRLCLNTCSGSVSDNFPTSWLPVSGTNTVLFEDTFESPTYTGTYNSGGKVNLSVGTSSVWGETGQGWSAAPTNQIPYWTSGCPQGNQCLELGWGTASNSHLNTLIARPFLLDPGYYQVSYDYVSEELLSGVGGPYCGTTPSAAGMNQASYPTPAATDRVLNVSNGNLSGDTNAVGVFMAHPGLVSVPNVSTTLGATTSYTNPDGTTTTTPTASPVSISLTNYDSTQNNPLLDICGYASTSQARSRYVLIQEPALYWLVLASLGAADGFGGQIDDVKITALGSPYMASAPASYVTIPVPNTQPGATISYTGFSITADSHW